CLHQGANALFQKEGIALRASDQELCEWRQADIIPEQRLYELVRTRWRQGVQAKLCIVGLVAPAVLVLWPIIDQEQQPDRRETLDQAVEQRLRLGVDPVQVFEDQHQRLHLAFAQ